VVCRAVAIDSCDVRVEKLDKDVPERDGAPRSAVDSSAIESRGAKKKGDVSLRNSPPASPVVASAVRAPSSPTASAPHHAGGAVSSSSSSSAHNNDLCIKLRGLPFSSTHNDLLDFLHGCVLGPAGAFIEFEPSGRPSGNAYAEFADIASFKRAKALHCTMMGHRFIEVFTCDKLEMSSALQIVDVNGVLGPRYRKNNNNNNNNNNNRNANAGGNSHAHNNNKHNGLNRSPPAVGNSKSQQPRKFYAATAEQQQQQQQNDHASLSLVRSGIAPSLLADISLHTPFFF
jgi:hypothetical protein